MIMAVQDTTWSRRVEGADAGFTLLELLVALALLGLLVPLVFGGLRFAVRASDRAAVVEQANDVTLVREYLRRQIGTIYPAYPTDGRPAPRIAFTGAHDKLAFMAPTPSAAGSAAMSYFVLQLKGARERHRLVLLWRPEFGSGDSGSLSSETVLADDVTTLKIAYFGKASLNDPPHWSDVWTGAQRLPELIRIRVGFPEGDRRLWPDLIVAPMVTVDSTCIYDPIRKNCRGRPSS